MLLLLNIDTRQCSLLPVAAASAAIAAAVAASKGLLLLAGLSRLQPPSNLSESFASSLVDEDEMVRNAPLPVLQRRLVQAALKGGTGFWN